MQKIESDNPQTGPVRAFSYVRMSTQKQLRGDSLRRQLERSRAFAEEHGLILDDSLRDIGVSAWKGKNFKSGALGRFLSMVESGEIPKGSYLLIESLDRLSREAVPDALTLFMALINAGVVIVTLGLGDRQIYSRDSLKGDWTKLIIGLAVMSRGHEESQTKSERIRAANRRKRQTAREGKGQITSLTPAWIDARRKSGNSYDFALNDHAGTVRQIYEMAARGLGATAIARKLNADGVATFKSKDGWYQSIIKSLLARHDVIGTFQPHRLEEGKRVPDGDPIESYFPAAIDKNLFLRVQAMRDMVGKPGRRGKSFANLFTGLCHCAHCLGPMTMKLSRAKNGVAGRYLVCSNYVRGQRCTDGRRHFRYEPFETAVLDHVMELNLAATLQRATQGQAVTVLDERISGLILKCDELRRKERRLAQAIEDNGQSLETILDLLRTRQVERQSVEAELGRLQQDRRKLIARQQRPVSTNERLNILRSAWAATGNDDERYALRSEAHAAIREILTEVTFDSFSETAMLVIANGVRAYLIRDGRVERGFDAFAA